MKKMLIAIIIATSLFTSCSSGQNQGNNVTVQTNDVPGFNVQNFANLVKKTSDPASIEKAINSNNNDVNGLDLNKDGNIDFLGVQEVAGSIQVIDNDVNPAVTVATLKVTQSPGNQASMNIQGNQQYCGPDYSYQSNFTLTDFLLLNYMLRPHPYYYPHYAYGYHPAYYRPYTVVSYRTRVYPTGYHSTYRSTSSGTYRSTSNGTYRSSTNNTVNRAPSTPQRSSLSSPVRSQRSFQVNSSNTGGSRTSAFGRSSSSGSSHSSFGSGGSRSSFGGGRSSFGGGGRRR